MATRQSVSDLPESSRLLLRSLGALELILSVPSTGDRAVPASGKAMALLAYLSCLSGRSASRDRLADLLWGTSSLESALGSIRQARSSLKKVVGAEVVVANGEQLTLANWVRVDRDTFRDLLSRQETAKACDLYTGPFCDRFAATGAEEFERWADVERASLKTRCAEAIASRAHDALSAARASEALTLAARLAIVDPDDERRWRFQLEALLLKSDAFGLNVALGECARWLADERREPSRALQALIDRSRRKPRQDDATGAHERITSLHPDLVGREREFSALLDAWNEVGSGNARCMTLLAPAGFGKTRLLHDLQERWAASHARFVGLRALPSERDVPFALASRLAAALGSCRGAAGLSERSASILLGLNPSLSSQFRSASATSAGASPLLSYIEALDELLTVVTEDARFGLVIDDLHWSDPDSAQVLAALGERQPNRRLFLVMAMRPQSASLARLPSCAVNVRLAPLTVNETDNLLGSIAHLDEGRDAGWRDQLCATSGGNPLLILESLRLAMDAGALEIREHEWHASNVQYLTELLAHRTVMGDRLARLPDGPHALALILAVAGRPLAPVGLSQAVAVQLAEVNATLHTLELRDVAIREATGWVIGHDSLAEALVESAEDDRLQIARAAAAQVLEQSPDNASLRAALQLFVAAGDWDAGARVAAHMVRGHGALRSTRFSRARATISQIKDARARVLIRKRMPLEMRYPLGVMALSGLALVLACGTLISARTRDPVAEHPANTSLILAGQTASGAVVARSVPLSEAGWASGSPLDFAHAPETRPWPSAGVYPGTVRMRDGAIAIERHFPDSGGVDVALWHPDGKEERLTYAKGDDVPGGWSPDGRFLLIASSRWGTRGHRTILSMDLETGRVRRLSKGGSLTASDQVASWSPDGSRVAFLRQYYDLRPSDLCIVDSDGQHERCEPLAAQPQSWVDPGHVLALSDSAGVQRTDLISADDFATQVFSREGGLCTVSPDTKWVLCSLSDGTRYSVAPRSQPQLRRTVIPPPNLDGGGAPVLISRPSKSESIDRIIVTSSGQIAPIGVGTMLHADAVTRNGEHVLGAALRWTLRDSSKGTLTQSGLLVASRPGEIVVSVSAGGWREGQVTVHAEAASSQIVLTETWSGDFASRWRLYGTPTPVSAATDGGRAFWNRGDGDHFSGAYLRQLQPATEGLWMEAKVSTPISATQWQVLQLMMATPPRRDVLMAWDHRTGYLPGLSPFGCSFDYPAGEGVTALRHISPGGDISRYLGYATDSLSKGGWYRVLIQLFPDRRCGVAIDGLPVFVGLARQAPADSVIAVIQGSSYGTRILVGAVTIGRGVRTDIAWQKAEQRARP